MCISLAVTGNAVSKGRTALSMCVAKAELDLGGMPTVEGAKMWVQVDERRAMWVEDGER